MPITIRPRFRGRDSKALLVPWRGVAPHLRPRSIPAFILDLRGPPPGQTERFRVTVISHVIGLKGH